MFANNPLQAPNGIVIGDSIDTWIAETSLDMGAFAPGTTTPISELAASFTVSETPYTSVKINIPGRGEMVMVSLKSVRTALWLGEPAAMVIDKAVSAATGAQ